MSSLALALSAVLLAAPPPPIAPPTGVDPARAAFLAGPDVVNHRIGDLSFIATFGRAPTAADSEALRMDTHLRFVRDQLGRRPATSPALAARRAELLGYLDDYIAIAHTPDNAHLPFRNPVFIDDAGAVCAVGYLIERSAGRPLAEAVAARFRVAHLEDIDMPEVRAWIAGSGLTLDELASIQPAYSPPPLDGAWATWVGPATRGLRGLDGPWTFTDADGTTTSGTWRKGKLEGPWVRTAAGGERLGSGTFKRGAGLWTGTYGDGAVAAVGPYQGNAPNGAWRLFYPSGRLAAVGAFKDGLRWGMWSFFHDVPGEKLLARGAFKAYEVGDWEHYDADGRHVATVWPSRGADGYGVTWYAPDGSVSSAAAVGNQMDGGEPGFTVAWYPSGALQAVRFRGWAAGTATFDLDGELMTLSLGEGEAEGPGPARDPKIRKQFHTLASLGRDAKRRGRPSERFLRQLDALKQRLSESESTDLTSGLAPAQAEAVAHDAMLARQALDGAPFRTTSAPTLFPACPAQDEDGGWSWGWAFCDRAAEDGVSPDGDALRGLLASHDNMVTAGFNYPHIDRIFDTAYATLVDKARVQVNDGVTGEVPNSPFQSSNYIFEDEYSWTTWGPVLKRHGVKLANVF